MSGRGKKSTKVANLAGTPPQRGAAATAMASIMSRGTGIIHHPQEEKKQAKRKATVRARREKVVVEKTEDPEDREEEDEDEGEPGSQTASPAPDAAGELAKMKKDLNEAFKRIKYMQENGAGASASPFPPPSSSSSSSPSPPASYEGKFSSYSAAPGEVSQPPLSPAVAAGGPLTLSIGNGNVLYNSPVTGGMSSSPAGQPPAGAGGVSQPQQVMDLLSVLASHPSLGDLGHVLALNKQQRKDTASNIYVPLSAFNPTPGRGAAEAIAMGPLTSSTMSDSAESFRQTINDIMGEENPYLKAAQAKRVRDLAPRFTSFEQVVAAYVSGLMPIACFGNPVRLADYTIFMAAVMMEHAKGAFPWPVHLKYIETIRRLALQANSPSTTKVDAIRAAHTLCGLSLSKTSLLNEQLYMNCGMQWASGALEAFEAEHVDHDVLMELLSRRAASRPSPSSSSSSSSSGGSGGGREMRTSKPKESVKREGGSPFSESEWTRLKALPSYDSLFCRLHVMGQCSRTKCSRPHMDAASIRAKYLATGPQ